MTRKTDEKPDNNSDHPAAKGDADRPGGGHAAMMADFKRRFWVSLAVTVPVLAISPMIQSFLNLSWTFPGDQWLLWGLSTGIFFYGGWPFLTGLAGELKDKQPGMMTLIGVAITVAYGYSTVVVWGVEGKVFFWELVTLIDIMLLGHWVEMRSVMGASMAVEKLAQHMPGKAHRINDDGSVEDVPLRDLQAGQTVRVKPGEKIPVDGTVEDGESEIDESLLTGESKPVRKHPGESVIGGAVNGNGALTVKVVKAGDASYLSQVIDLVRQAGESKSRAQGLADRAAFWLTVVALTAGTITVISWLLYGKPFDFALERMVTVMVITCPHALGLAIPLVVAVITSTAAQHGLLIRNRTAFEQARSVDMVVFDKTGTLTEGRFGVTDVTVLGDWDEAQVLSSAAAVEQHSEHSIARGITRAADERQLSTPAAKAFQAVAGKGASADIDGRTVWVGNREILSQAGAASEAAEETLRQMAAQGKTVVLVAADQTVQGLIALADVIRDASKDAVRQLHERGIQTVMITGDNEATAAYVAEALHLDDFWANVLPDKKTDKLKALQQQGHRLAMVGDGINDAPALAQADVGIAIGAGTDIAVETADVVLVQNDPRNVVDCIRLSKLTFRKTVQNLIWATGYNVIAIPLAAGVLYAWSIVLPPAAGALIMSVSTVIVAINAKLIAYERSG